MSDPKPLGHQTSTSDTVPAQGTLIYHHTCTAVPIAIHSCPHLRPATDTGGVGFSMRFGGVFYEYSILMYSDVFCCILRKYCILVYFGVFWCILMYSETYSRILCFAIEIHCGLCILMYSRCILSVSYAEDEIHQNTSRIHHDTRIHTLTHGPTRQKMARSRSRRGPRRSRWCHLRSLSCLPTVHAGVRHMHD